ncbi:dihydrofolate reductase family protein [Nonomuraea sp. SYSU D8015]|uniref:dihydrofolate reductase family protein n=1 Tax=Nonomuraea sp. SYSU D8015 TaxID=2593644 RepID=UPI001660C32E|nr:dihydrofolate reductase family protein [Nonomuraea sp. SYSU D8015]
MRLTVTAYLTLDGVMQAPGMPGEDRGGGFEQGGWQAPYIDEAHGRLAAGWFEAADAFLLGRRTYEIFAGHWPKVTDERDVIAARLNSRPKYVVSTTLDHLAWDDSTLISGDVADAVAELKRRPGDELQVHGSGQLVRTLMAHDLVDEYRLYIYPVILGGGRRLFPEGVVPTALTLVERTSTPSGAMVGVYQPAGRPRYGMAALEEHDGVVRDTFSRQAGLG